MHSRLTAVIGGALLFFAGSLASPESFAAPEFPAIMLFSGKISPASGPLSLAPRLDDRVLIFSAENGGLIGEGPVGNDGTYQALAVRTTSFNGAAIVFELQQGRRRYALQNHDGTAAWWRFAGRMLPERTALSLRIGELTAELSPDDAVTPQAQRLSRRPELPCDAQADVNEDGLCDEQDWVILRRYAGGVSRTVGRP